LRDLFRKVIMLVNNKRRFEWLLIPLRLTTLIALGDSFLHDQLFLGNAILMTLDLQSLKELNVFLLSLIP
jgi:hypothetical protein